MLKNLCALLLCALVAVPFAAPTQEELWKQVEQAESEDRIEDAIVLLQQAVQLPGPYTEEIEISLQAYAEVLGRPELLSHTAAKVPEEGGTTSEWGGSFELGGYGGLYQQGESGDEYREAYAGATGLLSIEYSRIRGDLLHTWSLSASVDEYIPIAAFGTDAEDSSLAKSYTIEPSLGYTLFWDRLLFGLSVDIPLVQEEDPSVAGSAWLSFALMRHGGLRWSLSTSAYGGPESRDQYSVRTTLNRKITEGVPASISAAYIVGIDTVSRQDVATLYESGAGPDFLVKLGWSSTSWRMETSAGYAIFTSFQKDSWTEATGGNSLTWKKQYVKTRFGLLLAWSLSESFEFALQGSYQVRKYPNMPTSHPESYRTNTSTIGGDLSLTYAF